MATPQQLEAKADNPRTTAPNAGNDKQRQQGAKGKTQRRGRSGRSNAAGTREGSGRSAGRSQNRMGKEPPTNGSLSGKDSGISKEEENASDEDEDENICFICADPVKFYAVGPCDHRTCHLCSLRLRALFKSKACPYCKTEIDSVIYTSDSEMSFAELSKRTFQHHDRGLDINFDSKEAYDATMYALQFNCPQHKCDYVDFDGWKGLKEHTRKEHALVFCDLCLKNKKSFAHEHKLFTKSQLRKHYSHGDNTGFPGHPDCEFCRTSFYDNDQLFDHCRKKHEQCFICVRNGTGSQVYFANYQTLEGHFNSEHYTCRHAACLEKKFVVFENDIDLQGHELEVHGSSIIGQRARREARHINVSFQYSSGRGSGGRATASGTNSVFSSSRPTTMTVNAPDDTGVSIAGRSRPSGFGHVSSSHLATGQLEDPSSAEPSSPEAEPESLWPTLGSEANLRSPSQASTSLSQAPMRDRAPTSFGRLSDNKASSSLPNAAPRQQPALSEATLASHQELLQRVSAYLSHREQPVERFRQLTTQYKDARVSANDYVQNCWLLFLTVPGKNAKEMIQKTMRSVADLLPDDKQKGSLLKALNEHRIKQQQFPALTPLAKAGKGSNTSSGGSARVLVIKEPGNSSARAGGWASQTAAGSSRLSPSPSSSRLASDMMKSPPSTSLAMAGFPSLGTSSSSTSLHSIGSRSGSTSGRQNAYSSKLSQSTAAYASAVPASQTSRSDFPDLPPSAPARRKFEPVNAGSPSAWTGSMSSSAGGAGKKAQGKPSRNSKGKQILFHVG
ncbi:hypothetical protein GGI12_000555 [Dipsacomyces acuminosporus]|nr:hypothetical protein GGI12_000555 [Dipsacomyces acuminosporus]